MVSALALQTVPAKPVHIATHFAVRLWQNEFSDEAYIFNLVELVHNFRLLCSYTALLNLLCYAMSFASGISVSMGYFSQTRMADVFIFTAVELQCICTHSNIRYCNFFMIARTVFLFYRLIVYNVPFCRASNFRHFQTCRVITAVC